MNCKEAFSTILYFTLTSFIVSLLVGALMISLEDLFLRRLINRMLLTTWFTRSRVFGDMPMFAFHRFREKIGNAFSLPPRQLIGFLGSAPIIPTDAASHYSIADLLLRMGKNLTGHGDSTRDSEDRATYPTAKEDYSPGDTAADSTIDLADTAPESDEAVVYIERALDDLQAFMERKWIVLRYWTSFCIAGLILLTTSSAAPYIGKAPDDPALFTLSSAGLVAIAALFAPLWRDVLYRVIGRGTP